MENLCLDREVEIFCAVYKSWHGQGGLVGTQSAASDHLTDTFSAHILQPDLKKNCLKTVQKLHLHNIMTLKTHFLLQTVLYKQIRESWNKLALKVNHASSSLGRLCTNQKCSVKDLAACEGLSP